MKRYFTFSDGISNKFWQIDPTGTTFTVTFGKIGTAGQSQTKTFDTADRCRQETDKLIREKTGKGYVELVNDVAVPATEQAAPRRPAERRTNPEKEADKEATATMLTRYDDIIMNSQTGQLLPFLQGVDTRHYPALRQKIKQAKKYWCDQELILTHYPNGNTHGRTVVRGGANQRLIVNLSGIALLSLPELKGFDGVYSIVSGRQDSLISRAVLEWAKPNWLTEFLLQQSNQGVWQTLPYYKLREVETAGLVSYQPELFARSVGSFQDYVYSPDTRKGAHQDYQAYIDFLTTDELALTRDLPTLFDYPVPVHDNTGRVSNEEEDEHKRIQIWPLVFTWLLNEGKLDRLWFLERCLSVQTKDWNINLRAFYRKQFEAANPTSADLLTLQPALFPLLAAAHPHVVNWIIGLIKTISTEADFCTDEMLDWASATMMRDDYKTGLKTLLTLFEQLMKTQPDLRPAITRQLADVFAINDPSLQTKAVTLLTKYGNPADTDLQTALQTYAGQMLGHVAGDLGAFLNEDDTLITTETDGPVSYQYAPQDVPKLVPDAEVHLPESWTDLLFLIGKFIGSDDPLAIEILMNALLVPSTNRPADFREQLKPYEKKLEKTYFQSKINQLTKSYLQHWIFNTGAPYVGIDTSSVQTIGLQRLRLQHLDRKQISGSRLPLLSLPTHAPHWIDPTLLIRRLLAYQQTGETIEPLDLAIAIARMPRENTTEALALCGQLDKRLASLMRYCLGEITALDLPAETVINRVLTTFKTINKVENQLDLWAVAARTFGPDSSFAEFANTALANYPNVVQPFVPDYAMRETWNEWQDYDTKQTMRSASWQILTVDLPKRPESMPTLLYSNDSLQRAKKDYYYFDPHPPDVAFWCSLIPQQPEALFTFIAGYGLSVSETEPAITQAITLMLQPDFRFREMSGLVLACGLLVKKRETRALAAEVLIGHIGEQTLDMVRLGDRLGWLLAGDHAPAVRLTDALNLVRDVSPLHNQALRLTLDALFAQFPTDTNLPKSTNKLLEVYLDLLVKTGATVPETTATLLRGWQVTASLKKICTAILKIT